MGAVLNKRVVLASGNEGKLREMRQMLQAIPSEIVAQSVFKVPSVAETGSTFVENALIKARHACAYTGLPALADDSGLAVDALDGEPGIHTARFAGENATDGTNIDKLLTLLKNVPLEARGAYFYCVIVFLRHADDPVPLICQGRWRGRILTARQGTGGFGYDPVFYVPSHHCSSAELPLEVKNAISHRGQALQQLVAKLTCRGAYALFH